MDSEDHVDAAAAAGRSADEIASVLRERGCLDGECTAEVQAWLAEAAALLGPVAPDRGTLVDLLSLVFHYDAKTLLQSPDHHAVMVRNGARDVIRALANEVLCGPEINSDRYKAMIAVLKGTLDCRGRELFHPIRMALAGRAGEGELDRVILLLDSATKLPFRVPVKGTRQRMLEFCAALE